MVVNLPQKEIQHVSSCPAYFTASDTEQVHRSNALVKLVNPTELLIDDTYQRDLSIRSIRLINRIVSNWSWSKFKPPTVTEVNGYLHVLDGQHVSIAAASHPLIDLIPVFIVDSETVQERAAAFVGINRDRVNVTPTDIFYADVSSEDADALALSRIVREAGLTILRQPKPFFEEGDTMSISTLRMMYKKYTNVQFSMILETCSSMKAAPVTADLLKMTAVLLFEKSYSSLRIISTVRNLTIQGLEEKARLSPNRKSMYKSMVKVVEDEIY